MGQYTSELQANVKLKHFFFHLDFQCFWCTCLCSFLGCHGSWEAQEISLEPAHQNLVTQLWPRCEARPELEQPQPHLHRPPAPVPPWCGKHNWIKKIAVVYDMNMIVVIITPFDYIISTCIVSSIINVSVV